MALDRSGRMTRRGAARARPVALAIVPRPPADRAARRCAIAVIGLAALVIAFAADLPDARRHRLVGTRSRTARSGPAWASTPRRSAASCCWAPAACARSRGPAFDIPSLRALSGARWDVPCSTIRPPGRSGMSSATCRHRLQCGPAPVGARRAAGIGSGSLAAASCLLVAAARSAAHAVAARGRGRRPAPTRTEPSREPAGHGRAPERPAGGRLPAVVREGLVRLRHAVDVVLALERAALLGLASSSSLARRWAIVFSRRWRANSTSQRTASVRARRAGTSTGTW